MFGEHTFSQFPAVPAPTRPDDAGSDEEAADLMDMVNIKKYQTMSKTYRFIINHKYNKNLHKK